MKDNEEALASSFLIVWRQPYKTLSLVQKCTRFVIRFFVVALYGDFHFLYFIQLNGMKLWCTPCLIIGKTPKEGLNNGIEKDAQKSRASLMPRVMCIMGRWTPVTYGLPSNPWITAWSNSLRLRTVALLTADGLIVSSLATKIHINPSSRAAM